MEWNKRGVDDGVEPAVVSAERADVGDLEAGVGQAPLGGFGLGELDGRRRKVEPDGGEAALREIQVDRRLAAADVEHVAVELALLDQRRDLRLRFADAPRRLGAEPQLRSLALVCVLEQIL